MPKKILAASGCFKLTSSKGLLDPPIVSLISVESLPRGGAKREQLALQQGNYLFACDSGKVFEKLVNRIATFEIID
jgi:hypothetical protein